MKPSASRVIGTQAGLSLLEMLMASFIGMLAVTGILHLYKSHQRSMLTQSGLADMRLNGQFALNEVQYFLSHAGLGLPGNMDDILAIGGDLAVKMNTSKRSAAAAKDPSSNTSRVVYRIPEADAALFRDKSYAVAMAGNLPMEAQILHRGLRSAGGGNAYVTLRGSGDDFPDATPLYPMERLRLHVCTGSGADTAAGDFRVFSERSPGRPATDTDSLTLAEGIQGLSYSYFLTNRSDSVTTLPSDLDALKSIRIQVVARTLTRDVHLPGDGFRRQTLAAKVNYRRSL